MLSRPSLPAASTSSSAPPRTSLDGAWKPHRWQDTLNVAASVLRHPAPSPPPPLRHNDDDALSSVPFFPPSHFLNGTTVLSQHASLSPFPLLTSSGGGIGTATSGPLSSPPAQQQCRWREWRQCHLIQPSSLLPHVKTWHLPATSHLTPSHSPPPLHQTMTPLAKRTDTMAPPLPPSHTWPPSPSSHASDDNDDATSYGPLPHPSLAPRWQCFKSIVITTSTQRQWGECCPSTASLAHASLSIPPPLPLVSANLIIE
ncbi:hypothetical protein BDQ17DRAFT_1435482 [Cyathus striatus]|nr:hypothetical protein BDQ17DRAFT_1435482 [Cyathus striatus]